VKLPFQSDAAGRLKKVEAALSAGQQKIAALQAARTVALQESDPDDIGAIQKIDLDINNAQAAVRVHQDRAVELRRLARARRDEEAEKAYRIAIVEIEKRLAVRTELAAEVEAAVKRLGDAWDKLLSSRSAILGAWPEVLVLPHASDFYDVKEIRQQLAHLIYAAGKPAWNRGCALPPPLPPVGVTGLEPVGVVGAVAAENAAFIARLRPQRIDHSPDEEAA
jgi:hypothetical protein